MTDRAKETTTVETDKGSGKQTEKVERERETDRSSVPQPTQPAPGSKNNPSGIGGNDERVSG